MDCVNTEKIVMIKFSSYAFVLGSFFGFVSCNSTEGIEEQSAWSENVEYVADENEQQVEEYLAYIDDSDALNVGNSLYYTREDGATIEVEIFLNDSSQILKTVEEYTRSASASIQTNIFYYKDNRKYATKEFFETGEGEEAVFTERVTYYDQDGKPKLSKQRVALFEDALVEEMFAVVRTTDCSDQRMQDVLNQTGEFETTFQGFVSEGPQAYLIVGENRDGGYRSALLVQFYTPLIKRLMDNEGTMKGTPLIVEFEKVNEAKGFEFQALMGLALKK